MEIQYQNTQADLKAFYEDLWCNQKVAQRKDYYLSTLWYLAVLVLGGYVALKHDDIYALCIFLVLAAFYVKQNWSFSQQWNARLEQYAEMTPESSCTLVLDETGATEHFSGIHLHVPWTQIHDYSLTEHSLFIRFLKFRSFVIPFRYLESSQCDDLIKFLEHRGIRKKNA